MIRYLLPLVVFLVGCLNDDRQDRIYRIGYENGIVSCEANHATITTTTLSYLDDIPPLQVDVNGYINCRHDDNAQFLCRCVK